jgi:hypothetical protein
MTYLISKKKREMQSGTENYQTLLEPIFFLLDIECKHHLEFDKMNELYDKYKEDLFKNENSISEIRKLISHVIAVCLSKINEKYRKKIATIYTDSGVDTILYDYVYTKLVEGFNI